MDNNGNRKRGRDVLPSKDMSPAAPLRPKALDTRSLFEMLRERRGWTSDYLYKINDPSYGTLKDLDALVEELHGVRSRGEQIVVLPDFDMDGVTSGTLMWAGLAELGLDVRLYVPDYRRGHDVTPEAVEEAHALFPLATTMITTDSGVNSHAGIGRGKELGLRMLVTDHHVQLDNLSPADVIVDPERIDEDYAHPGICGAFVAYQVLEAYARKYAPERSTSIRLLRLFAGIGTVSDVMPMFYENRQVVRDSLSVARMLYHSIPSADLVTEYDVETTVLMRVLRSDPSHAPEFVSAFEGFAIAMQAFREHGPLVPVIDRETGEPQYDELGEPVLKRSQGKLRSMADLTEEFYGFYLSPAFNSIRRANGSMHDAFGVFTASSPEQKRLHAEAVIDCNERRKKESAEWLELVHQEEQPLASHGVYFTDAPTGMLGLMASALMRDEDRPVVVVRRPEDPSGPVGGSARSPFWFPIITTMTALGYHAVGHENACGVSAQGLDGITLFAEAMSSEAARILAEKTLSGEVSESIDADLVLGPLDRCDAALADPEELLFLAQGIESVRPYGHGFPRPEVEMIVDLSRCSIQTLGSDESHLKIVLPIGVKLLWWGEAGRKPSLEELADSPIPGESLVSFRVTLGINVFMGTTSVQAVIEQAKPLAEGVEL